MKKLLFLILVLCLISGTSSKAQLTPKEKGLDQVNLVNWDKMLNIIKLGYLQMWEAANSEIK